jgi:protein O-GlcNAc transferase
MASTPTPDLLQDALALHRRGAFAEAAARYAAILQADPANADAYHYLAMISCQHGRFAEGAELARKSLAVDPRQAPVHFLLGRALSAQARLLEALASLDEAIRLAPDLAQAHGIRANVLGDLGRTAESIAAYDRALALMPDSAEDWFNRGLALAASGRRDDAVSSFDRALALRPDFLDALVRRAGLLAELKRHDEALAAAETALAVSRDNVDALVIRGVALGRLGLLEESLASLDRALAIKPDNVDALVNRGQTLNSLGDYGNALLCLNLALAREPHNVAALINCGVAKIELQRNGEALELFDRAVAADPDSADAHFNRGLTLSGFRRYPEAIASFERALEHARSRSRVLGELAMANRIICDWPALEKITDELLDQIGRSPVDPFLSLSVDTTPEQQLAGAKKWVDEVVGAGRPRLPAQPRIAAEKTAAGKIRIAYLSADFRSHPTSYLLADLIERHDRERFEVIGISFGVDDGSALRRRMENAFDRFHDVTNVGDIGIARLLHEHGVHVAVDLMGLTQFARLGVFASRPAPVQVNYLGYPGTTGAAFMDYILADKIVAPFAEQRNFSESIVHLPDSYQVNEGGRPIAELTPSRQDAALPNDGLVFCCFNSSFKLTRGMFDLWMRLLDAVPASVLWLLASNQEAMNNLRREAMARDIDPRRLVFAPRAAPAEHLARHRLADLFLDTLPYNAHTTANDALRAGLPVLTLKGNTFAGRVAASLLHAVGLPELITDSAAEYEALARNLATDRVRLATIQRKLQDSLKTAPLFDSDRYRRNIEQAYVTMVDIWRRGEPPRSFAVEPIQGAEKNS